MSRTTTTLAAVVQTLLLLLLAPLALAQDDSVEPQIFDESDRYLYHGCFNETTDIPETARERALNGEDTLIAEDAMTVPLCLSFCGGDNNNTREYNYAGLEFGRECWCGNTLSGLAERFDDSACTSPCDGDETMVCGGPLKLTVYMLDSAATRLRAATGVALLASAWMFSAYLL